jgi:glycosyltransferase involved in cell wall biosynthesis
MHTSHPLDPLGPHSGAETALFRTARALAERGHRVSVAGHLARDVELDGVRYLRTGEAGEYSVEAGLARLRGTCDVLVSTAGVGILARSLDDPSIGKRILWPNTTVFEAIGLDDSAFEVVDHFVLVSHHQARLFIERGVPLDRLSVVPNGVDPEVFAPGPWEQRSPNRLLFVGALVPDKGLDLLLTAMPAVRKLVPGAELVVCGSPGLWGREPYIDTDAVSASLPYVRFRGALAHDAVADELRRAVLCVAPSPPERYVEAFPLVAVEAQACGTPVVVTRNGGLPESLIDGETGWIVEPCTAAAIGAVVVRALRDPERLARMSQAAAERARREYSWSKNAAVFEALATAPCDATSAPERRAAPVSLTSSREPARVALVTTWRQPCGLARYAASLVATYPPESVVVLAEDGCEWLDEEIPGVAVERSWRRGAGLDGLVAAAEEHGVRLVHVNHHGALFADRTSELFEKLAARGIASVVTMHAANQLDREIAAIGRVANRVVVPTEGSRLEVIANGVAPEVIQVIPHGVAAVATHDVSGLRREMGLKAGEKLVLSLGFVQPHKGVHEVIRALAALRDRMALQYLVLGSVLPNDPTGPAYRDQCLAEAQRLGVADRVTLVEGYIPQAAYSQYLRAADLIVLPYATAWWESSLSAREAIASGRPVITSQALAFFDLGPAVFRTTGSFHLAQAIASVLGSPELAAELVRQARVFAGRHSWQKIGELYQKLYANVLSEVAGDRRAVKAAPRPAPSRVPTREESRTPRILFLLREHATETGGGDTAYAHTIARNAPSTGCEIVVQEGGEVSRDCDLVHLFNFSTYARTQAHARQTIEQGTPYVVSSMYEDWPSFKLAAEELVQRWRVRLGLRPTVDLATYAEMHATEQHDMLAADRFVAEHARLVIATGPSEEARLARDFPGIRCRSIPVAVPELAAGDADAFREKFGTSDFVLCVGRIEPRKNQLTLLEALADDPVDVVLATGGYAYRTDYLEACRRFHRRGRTLYLPELSPSEVTGAYRAARVHVLPSWFELPGLVTLEALRAGCAAVASDRGSLRDHLGETIPYAPPDDAAALRKAIESADAWSFLRARELALSLTVERHVARWKAVYSEILSERGRKAVAT